jgi:DNA-binding NarL/FixJ family response regulator
MPEQGGIETIQALKKLMPQIKIIAISGAGNTGVRDVLHTAMSVGAHQALQKPVRRADLLAAVQTLLLGP